MIDEKKLIEKIEFSIKASNTQHDNYMSGLRNGMRYCLALITRKEPGFEECKQWIPVSERLPENDGFYLVTLDGAIVGENRPFTGLAEFEDGKWIDDEEDYKCVIAWQPLPEPYQGGREE